VVVGAGGTPQATAEDVRPALEAFEATLARIEAQQRRVEETQRVKYEAVGAAASGDGERRQGPQWSLLPGRYRT
jgi:hypothetical protein